MKRSYLFLILLLALSACDNATNNMKANDVPKVENSTTMVPPTNGDQNKSEAKISPAFLAKDDKKLSIQDYETAYKMTTKALTQYYKAIWNNAEFDADAYFSNENLKQYTTKKIKDQYNLALKHDLTSNIVTNVEFETDEVKLVDDTNQYLYLKLKAAIKHDVGGYGEVTEFLVQNQEGKLVIVDWYCGAKDSYDMSVRGAGQEINNPNVWNDYEWVEQLKLKVPQTKVN
jgi:hypothetical protein